MSFLLNMLAKKLMGCPDHGYIEISAEEVLQRIVEIQVDLGMRIALFLIGLLQGNGFSCPSATLVVDLKHRGWACDMNTLPTKVPNFLDYNTAKVDPSNPMKSYVFESKDIDDSPCPSITSLSFCDDNLRFGSASSMDEAIVYLNKWIKLG